MSRFDSILLICMLILVKVAVHLLFVYYFTSRSGCEDYSFVFFENRKYI